MRKTLRAASSTVATLTPGRTAAIAGLLSLQNRLVHTSGFAGWPPHVHGTGPVRTITGEYNTEVADDESAARDASLRSAPMNDRRTLAGGNDRGKRHALCSRPAGGVLHGGGDFDFFHSGTDLPARDWVKRCAQSNRIADQANFVLVFDRASLLDERRRKDELPLALENGGKLLIQANGYRGGLNSEARSNESWKRPETQQPRARAPCRRLRSCADETSALACVV